MDGGTVSELVMTNEQFPVLFALSDAWHQIGVAPSVVMVSGDVWLQTTEPLIPEKSEAVTTKAAVEAVEVPPLGETVKEPGQFTVGAAESTIEREIEQEAVLLA